MKRFIITSILFVLATMLSKAPASSAEGPSFDADILPIFKSRCIDCHSGDGAEVELDLSSRDALLKGSKHGAVVTPGSLRDSRLWQKIHMEIMPADGDPLSDEEKALVRAWIVGGAGDPAAAATWDPSATLSHSEKPGDPLEVASRIDQLIDAKLIEAGIPKSPPADELVWLRRVHLDITGRPPSYKHVKDWAEGRVIPTHAEAVDQLFAGNRYGGHFANVWHNRIVPLDGNRREYDNLLRRYLSPELNEGTPWSEIVRFLLTIQQENGKEKKPIAFYNSRQHPKLMSTDATRIFLGVQLECAECHNHPAARWTQEEYWGMAAFFSTVQAGKGRVWEGKTKDDKQDDKKKDNKNDEPMLEPGTIEIPGDVLADAGEVVEASFLGGGQPQVAGEGPWRPPLADWMTSPENPWFARAFVNHTWQQFFGRGLVNPVDDLDAGNPPSHPQVLDLLAAEFIASGFDHKHIVRCICNTAAYRRSSTPVEGNVGDNLLLSHAPVRMLSPEQFYSSLSGMGLTKGFGKNEEFITFFMNPDGVHDARKYHHGLLQVMRLMNNEGLHGGGRAASDAFKAEEKEAREKAIARLYRSILCRHPTAEEIEFVAAYFEQADDLEAAYDGVGWMLLNSAEFAMNY